MALTNGLVVMKPSSVAKTGASSTATINADGSVTFGSCESLSLNGVFSSDYDNYMIQMRAVSSGGVTISARMRSAGTDASVANYARQRIGADATTVSAARSTGTEFDLLLSSNVQRVGMGIYVFGPYLSQPTAHRVVGISDSSSARIFEFAGTHSLSNSYDGISFISFASGVSLTGLVTVFGFNQ